MTIAPGTGTRDWRWIPLLRERCRESGHPILLEKDYPGRISGHTVLANGLSFGIFTEWQGRKLSRVVIKPVDHLNIGFVGEAPMRKYGLPSLVGLVAIDANVRNTCGASGGPG